MMGIESVGGNGGASIVAPDTSLQPDQTGLADGSGQEFENLLQSLSPSGGLIDTGLEGFLDLWLPRF